MESIKCPHCHHQVGSGRFCSECGGALPLFCRDCGHAVQRDQKFCSECGASLLQKSSPLAAQRASEPLASPGGERRHITVMFCDLMGSTDLSRRLDPEVLRDLMRHFVPAVGADTVPAWPGSFGPSHEPWPTASTATAPAPSTPSLSSTHVTLLLPPPLVQLAQPTADFFESLLQQPGFLWQQFPSIRSQVHANEHAYQSILGQPTCL